MNGAPPPDAKVLPSVNVKTFTCRRCTSTTMHVLTVYPDDPALVCFGIDADEHHLVRGLVVCCASCWATWCPACLTIAYSSRMAGAESTPPPVLARAWAAAEPRPIAKA